MNKGFFHLKFYQGVLILFALAAGMGLSSCDRDKSPKKAIEGMIRKGETPSTPIVLGPQGQEQPSDPNVDAQLKRLPGWNTLEPPRPEGMEPEVQRVMKTVDDVNRINSINRRNQ